jgi:hypothetical protein
MLFVFLIWIFLAVTTFSFRTFKISSDNTRREWSTAVTYNLRFANNSRRRSKNFINGVFLCSYFITYVKAINKWPHFLRDVFQKNLLSFVLIDPKTTSFKFSYLFLYSIL